MLKIRPLIEGSDDEAFVRLYNAGFSDYEDNRKMTLEELKKTRWFIEEMEKLGDNMLVGERPHRHHLLHFETPLFWEISKRHKRKGFFLSDEMLQRKFVGLHRGLSKHVKLSVYGLSWEKVHEVRDAFYEIAEKYVKEYNLEYAISK